MGIVYKAEDTKLDRTVAIKVLPASALSSQDDRARFYREAKSAAALNHPHIAQIYQIEEAVPEGGSAEEPRPFIAMEFIDGSPLDALVKEKPLKLKQAVGLATQIAEALQAAHEAGIVHRDIKCANVMLTAKGKAKVLDFGLAKTTHSTMLTRMGSTLGTVAYMSPEQARGEDVDHRTDLWALGVVLYEMLTGRNPFGGDYEQAVVYSILNETPDPLTAMRTGVPMQLEWIVNKCLAKDAGDRYQNAGDLIVDLRNVDLSDSGITTSQVSMASTRSTSAVPAAQRSWAHAGIPLIGLLVGVLVTWFGIRSMAPEPDPAPLTHVEISLPTLDSFRFPTLSPDGRYMALLATSTSGVYGVFLREMATGSVTHITGSNEAGDRELAFSTDGSKLAFTRGTNEGVFVVDVPTGIPELVVDFGRLSFWTDETTFVFSDDKIGGGATYSYTLDEESLLEIPIDTTSLEESYGNILKSHIPGTNRAFGHQLVRLQGGNMNEGKPVDLFTVDMTTGELDVIIRNAINPEYLGDGLLMYQVGNDDGELVVRPIDPETGRETGPPTRVFPERTATSWGEYRPTPSGDLIFPSLNSTISLRPIVWVAHLEDESIRNVAVNYPDDVVPAFATLSPDGRHVAMAYSATSQSGGDVMMVDRTTNERIQLTFNTSAFMPVFHPTEPFIYYSSGDPSEGEVPQTFRIPLGEIGPGEMVIDGGAVVTFSDDGSKMAYSRFSAETGIATLVLRNGSTGEERILDDESAFPFRAMFSPNGRYVTYMKDPQSGTIGVTATDGSLPPMDIPGVAGGFPMFTPDGEAILFMQQGGIWRIPVRTSPSFAVVGAPESVIQAIQPVAFHLGSDGNELLVVANLVDFVDTGSTEWAHLIWLQNFTSQYLPEGQR